MLLAELICCKALALDCICVVLGFRSLALMHGQSCNASQSTSCVLAEFIAAGLLCSDARVLIITFAVDLASFAIGFCIIVLWSQPCRPMWSTTD